MSDQGDGLLLLFHPDVSYASATVVLVISDQIHESVVRQDPGIDSTAFHPKILVSKETRARVWVRLVDGYDTAER